MSQTISNEYNRSVTRVMKMRDRAFQISGISGIMLSIFGGGVVFPILRGIRVSIPVFIILTESIVLISFSVIFPIWSTSVFGGRDPHTLGERSLRFVQRGVLSDRDLIPLMILCIKVNRSYVERYDLRLRLALVGVIAGTEMLAGALIAIAIAISMV